MTSEEMNQRMPVWRTQYELRTGQQSQMTAQQIKIVVAGPPELTTDEQVVDAMIVYAGMDPANYPYSDQTLPTPPPPPVPDNDLPGPALPGFGDRPKADNELPAKPPPAEPKG
jgi:hypothetical protein